jgi:hypothetical protein
VLKPYVIPLTLAVITVLSLFSRPVPRVLPRCSDRSWWPGLSLAALGLISVAQTPAFWWRSTLLLFRILRAEPRH